MTKLFLDTNVLVYGQDKDNPRKRELSLSIQSEFSSIRKAVISTQVLQEFYHTVTRKQKVEPVRVKEIMQSWSHIETVIIDRHHIDRAIDISMLNRISFWDGLILAAAESARCKKVLTEDMSHGQTIAGVLIENPFR